MRGGFTAGEGSELSAGSEMLASAGGRIILGKDMEAVMWRLIKRIVEVFGFSSSVQCRGPSEVRRYIPAGTE